MASETPPAAYSPKAKGDNEVLSQRTFPGQGEILEAVKAAPEGDTSAAGHMGEQAPMETDGSCSIRPPSEHRFGDPYSPGVRQAASIKRRRSACPTGDLYPTRGAG